MTAVAVALAAALLLTVAGPALLARAAHAGGLRPGAMLGLWTLASATWLLTWGAMLAMLVAEVMGPGVKGFVTACVTLLQAMSGNGAVAWIGLLALITAAAAARFGWVVLRRSRDTARWRRDHHRRLASRARRRTLAGRPVWLVDTDRPDAYCVPGRRAGVVVTRGALDALSAKEMRAVLAHEQAHLRGRHHLLVSWARLLNAAFPGVPLLRAAAREVPVLVEWAADDHAARSVGAASLLHALGAMAVPAERSEEALAASGACTVQRARRLLDPSRAGGDLRRRAVAAAAAAVLLLAPPALALGSAAITVATSPPCACTL
ncbi:M56 family metallopeptidase [Nocardiopsis sp. CNT-189]|uniref:M56 family metallopeptidase n=1 Tax=Nocardiopsis oceanisediminis TaxID=2816862 RepID=UPI003B396FA7